jgi:hypothetical protein
MQNDVHQITITQKKEVAITGVDGVLAFSETKITLSLRGGGRLYVAGSGLKIAGFSKENGVFTASGGVVGVSYGGKSFAARLFR